MLSTRAQQAALLIARGVTAEEAARIVGVDRRSVTRWAGTEEFQAEMARLRTQLVADAIATLRAGLTEASEALRALVTVGNEPRVRLRAAKELIAGYINLNNMAELEERVRALEEQARASTERPDRSVGASEPR